MVAVGLGGGPRLCPGPQAPGTFGHHGVSPPELGPVAGPTGSSAGATKDANEKVLSEGKGLFQQHNMSEEGLGPAAERRLHHWFGRNRGLWGEALVARL